MYNILYIYLVDRFVLKIKFSSYGNNKDNNKGIERNMNINHRNAV